jgi:hypothetical protein
MLLFVIGISWWAITTTPKQDLPPECPTFAFSRANLKEHLATHGEVSEGKWITAEDSKLWDICERVCDPEMSKLMERYLEKDHE